MVITSSLAAEYEARTGHDLRPRLGQRRPTGLAFDELHPQIILEFLELGPTAWAG